MTGGRLVCWYPPDPNDLITDCLRREKARHEHALSALNGKTRATTYAQERHRKAISDLEDALADHAIAVDRRAAMAEVVDLLVTWDGVGPQVHFSCSEAETFSRLLTSFGRSTAAHIFLTVHAEADTDPDDTHHHLRRSA